MKMTNIIELAGILSLAIGTALQAADLKPVATASSESSEEVRYVFKEKHDRDGIGKFYHGREIAHVMGHLGAGWLERSSREVEEEPETLMDALKLKEGMAVADIGAGSGYFSRRMARRIGDSGLVYAVDIQPEMLEILGANMTKEGLKNFKPILGGEKDPKLAPGTIDLVLMVDVYHEFSYPHEMMTAIHKALKPGGRVAFIEYRGEDDWVPIKPLHKMTQAQVKREATSQGYKWIETLDVLPRQHIILFGKQSLKK